MGTRRNGDKGKVKTMGKEHRTWCRVSHFGNQEESKDNRI